MVKVTSADGNTFVVVRINDRIASGKNHIIELSGAAAHKIGLFESGFARVHVATMESASFALRAIESSDVEASSSIEKQPQPLKPAISESAPIRLVTSRGASDRGEAYTLQIGSFSTLERAQILADQYNEAWTARVDVNGAVTYRVYYSRYDQEKPARVAQNDLWTQGQDSFLRKVVS